MDDDEYLERQRQDLRESVGYFAPQRKGERELWVARALLENLNIPHQETELVLAPEDPPDVFFRDARFEIKEIMDAGRRRHSEYREALRRAESATAPKDLLSEFTPKDISIKQVYELALTASISHQTKYASSVCGVLVCCSMSTFRM